MYKIEITLPKLSELDTATILFQKVVLELAGKLLLWDSLEESKHGIIIKVKKL